MAAPMQGYMASLAKFAETNPEQLGYPFYEWMLDKFGIPDEGENINFNTYATEYIQEVG